MKTLVVWYEWSGFAVQIKNHIEEALTELQIEWKECYIEDLEKVTKEFTPTMTIHFHPTKLIYDHLETIKSLGGHKLLWDMESPYESDIVFDMLPYFYYIFTSDKATARELKKVGGSNHVEYVPHACNPKVHKPMDVTWEYKSDWCFVGNAYKSRLEYLQKRELEYKNGLFTLVGVGYRGLDGFQGHHVIHGHISEEEMIKYYCGTKTALNLHRMMGDLDMNNVRGIAPEHLNNRFYELSAMGVKQIVVGRDNMTDEIKAVEKQTPEEYSYKARLRQYYLPLLS